MDAPLIDRTRSPGRSALRGLLWTAGVIAGTAAVAVGAVLALVFVATAVVIALMSVALLGLAGASIRARRTARTETNPDLIQARNVGGHSWVAYGWDGPR